MSEAERLLGKILEAGDVIGRDAAGRTILLLALDPADLERLMALRLHARRREDAGDDTSYRMPPISVCWLDAA